MTKSPGRRADAPYLPPNLKRHTAVVLREIVCPEWWANYLIEIAQGRDPRVTLANRDPATYRELEKRQDAPKIAVVPTLEQSMGAIRELMMRRDGAPAQQIHLEAVLAASAQVEHRIDTSVIGKLSAEAAEALQAWLQRALQRPGSEDEPELALSAGNEQDADILGGE